MTSNDWGAVAYPLISLIIFVSGVIHARYFEDKKTTADDASTLILVSLGWGVVAVMFLAAWLAHNSSMLLAKLMNGGKK